MLVKTVALKENCVADSPAAPAHEKRGVRRQVRVSSIGM
ncbi:hypothetical protein ACPOL_4381 [Acidisarcina polymorpha]|uniref:Uncharacterized protein n=1 Tax=Acidisarcina polymorpha TaxID=2211140 RepID=A0A2Z5G4A3_9BACT|nr:hypothetical protein ACPOL_4381 [Acidisarcina polymorpha]